MSTVYLESVVATPSNTADYGLFLGEQVGDARLPIPFYSHVDEGLTIPFEYVGQAVIRRARIHPTTEPVCWLERHLNMTQFFIGLGQSPFALVLGKPTQEHIPDLQNLACLIFPPGSGILLKKGTWHDFPLAIDTPVTCLTGNSSEVVEALIRVKEPREMNEGDVYKINLRNRFDAVIQVAFK